MNPTLLVCVGCATQLDLITSSTAYVIGETYAGEAKILYVMSKWVCPVCRTMIAATTDQPLASKGDPQFDSLLAIAERRENTKHYTLGSKT